MVRADFRRGEQGFMSVRVTGHADFAPEGEDIVCAGVTSAVQFTANGITEVVGAPAEVSVLENEISIVLPQKSDCVSLAFLQALHLHLSLLQQEYPQHITVMEV